MKFASIFSSSSGNCLYMEMQKTKILIDCGVSGVMAQNELKKIGVDISQLDGIIVTHEHSDHIKGVGVLSRRYDIPVYTNEKTWNKIEGVVGNISDKNIRCIKKDKPFTVKDFEITPFETPHDAIDPFGYVIDDGKNKGGIATDMGMILEDIVEKLSKCKFVFLESNHDIDMVKSGNYPINLKKRILSPLGHLSNEDAGIIISKLVENDTRFVGLGHLSSENNTKDLALSTVFKYLKENSIEVGKDIEVSAADKLRASSIVDF